MPLQILRIGSKVLPTMQRVPPRVHGPPSIPLQLLKDLMTRARARARTLVPFPDRDGEDKVPGAHYLPQGPQDPGAKNSKDLNTTEEIIGGP